MEMDTKRKTRRERLSAAISTETNEPVYIKAGFETEKEFLEWLLGEPREVYTQWGYSNHGMIGSDYSDLLREEAGLPPAEIVEPDDEDETFIVPAGRHIEN